MHFFNSHRRLHLLMAMALLLSAPALATNGTELIGIGALQKGTAGAGIASPQDMTWVLLNPASIIDMGCRLDVNMEVFAPRRYNEPHGIFGYDLGGHMEDNTAFLIPSMGYSRSCGCGDHAWGIGLYGVSGMGVDYESSRAILPKLFLQNYDRRTEYSVGKLVYGYAHDIGKDWVLGGGLHFNYSRFKSDMLTLKFAQAQKDNEWDDALGAGFSLGLYKRWDRLALGATYTSRQWMGDFNDYDDLFFESLDLPQSFQIGLAYFLTPDIEVVADYKWINWSGVDQYGVEPLQGGFGWKDQHVFKTGITWYASPKWTFRAGYAYGKSPIDEEHVFANGLFPAITEHHVSVGLSYALNEKDDIHFTYMHAFENELTDNGRGDLFSILGKGSKIGLEENTFTFEFSHKFAVGNCYSRRMEWRKEEYERQKGEGRF